MAERALAGEAGQDHQGDADDGVDEDEDELALEIARQHQRRREHERDQREAYDHQLPAVLEEADVLVVAGLE